MPFYKFLYQDWEGSYNNTGCCTGSDFSPDAVHIAQKEAQIGDLEVEFSILDMRDLDQDNRGSIDLIIVCEIAIPHHISRYMGIFKNIWLL